MPSAKPDSQFIQVEPSPVVFLRCCYRYDSMIGCQVVFAKFVTSWHPLPKFILSPSAFSFTQV